MGVKDSGVPEYDDIRRMIIQEQSEGAVRDCILDYQRQMMNDAMKVRGIYLAYYSCGFSAYESLMLTLQHMR